MSKKVTNTENNPRIDWLGGFNPNAIVKQEAKGQEEFVESLQLPKKSNGDDEKNVAALYHKLGIQTFPTSKGDDLFIGAKLPKGWEKKATDHSMWSDLLDDKGRKRASIFYKAAFYDRDAFISFNKRYSIQVDRIGFIKNDYSRKDGEYASNSTPMCGVFKDWDNTIIFKTVEVDCHIAYKPTGGYTKEYAEAYSELEARFRKECLEFMEKNFPNYLDIAAYWD